MLRQEATMAEPARKPMTVDDFLAWAESWGDGERYELFDGVPVRMSAERSRHALVKSDVDRELQRAVAAAGLRCTVWPDGMTVPIGDRTAFEPDAVVQCGPPPDLDAVRLDAPLIVVEVLSPATRGVDLGRKLPGYFSRPSLAHYLIVDPETRLVIRHSRREGGLIETAIHVEGAPVALDPPGLTIVPEAFFARITPPA
jgi:Uma2 family endonuclease